MPVKALALAKTRLALPAPLREDLALAFVLDTVAALRRTRAVARILVVSADPVVRARLDDGTVQVVPDAGGDLRAAVGAGIEAAVREGAADVLVVPADLPCLREDDVARVLLDAASTTGAFVPDRLGTGTTMLARPGGTGLETRYGPGSAALHEELGLVRLDGAPVRARHDVDTLDDLREAVTLGLGRHTTAALAAAGWLGAAG